MHTILKVFLLALLVAMPAQAQEFRTRLQKPQHTYFYVQSNLHGGIDSREPGAQVADQNYSGLSNRGPASQVTFELFNKRERRIQTGYTRFITPNAWNVKLGIEANPISNDQKGDVRLGLRLGDTWANFSTKWDRTQFRVGHLSIPYGHNPRIDGNMSFLPNQSGTDIGFGSDTGVLLRTGLTQRMDLELSATGGGFLAGQLLRANLADGQDFVVNDFVKYRGSFMGIARVGTPTFHRNELGVFVAAGELHRDTGDQPRVARVGADWVFKSREGWKFVNQVNLGRNDPSGATKNNAFTVYNVLNSVEMFAHARLRMGMTSVLRFEDRIDTKTGKQPKVGTVYGMFSIPITRTTRFRINPYMEYADATGDKDRGVLFQVCTNCGLIK